ncbi:hypothetical protein A3D11_01050 [Candidatus Peribacteria bacterium RIFCSPHIGHO2_02_FULL_49_16]|nr:MAG: hypothetical protein A2880_00105 [Candidatus Peribacteria bacterium RIFCSPHIGHO2_01_FULL_49_38]OGJ59740.1 MAG: hypothetical protein A3D11_01050 [Candidatus Peribacteria bacterium RIFCSPHIGHO2_02_FULL_49_16]
MMKGRFLPRRRKNNPVIREYEQAVERGDRLLKESYHVVRQNGEWMVRRSKEGRIRTYETQAEAVDAAKRTARRERTELFIHGRDGRIRERSSYGDLRGGDRI